MKPRFRATPDPVVAGGSYAHDHQIFTAKLVKKHLSFPDRAVASAIRAAEGQFRNWADIRAWAAGLADTLLS